MCSRFRCRSRFHCRFPMPQPPRSRNRILSTLAAFGRRVPELPRQCPGPLLCRSPFLPPWSRKRSQVLPRFPCSPRLFEKTRCQRPSDLPCQIRRSGRFLARSPGTSRAEDQPRIGQWNQLDLVGRIPRFLRGSADQPVGWDCLHALWQGDGGLVVSPRRHSTIAAAPTVPAAAGDSSDAVGGCSLDAPLPRANLATTQMLSIDSWYNLRFEHPARGLQRGTAFRFAARKKKVVWRAQCPRGTLLASITSSPARTGPTWVHRRIRGDPGVRPTVARVAPAP